MSVPALPSDPASPQPGPADPLTVASRFNGPPGSGNGGYVAGLLAARTGTGPVTVTLRQPPPLERTLRVVPEPDAGAGLYDGDLLVAQAVPADPAAVEAFEPVDPVPFDVAAEAEAFFSGRHGHPFPGCFVCGPDRAQGDGLRLLSGLLPQRPGTTAAAWTPHASLATDGGAWVRPEFVWAALDCPGAWTVMGSEVPALLLGRITARVDALPLVGDRCVVMGRVTAREGRKVHTDTTLYDGDGRVAAHARALWIAPRPQAAP